jgi:hypothetical protein
MRFKAWLPILLQENGVLKQVKSLWRGLKMIPNTKENRRVTISARACSSSAQKFLSWPSLSF